MTESQPRDKQICPHALYQSYNKQRFTLKNLSSNYFSNITILSRSILIQFWLSVRTFGCICCYLNLSSLLLWKSKVVIMYVFRPIRKPSLTFLVLLNFTTDFRGRFIVRARVSGLVVFLNNWRKKRRAHLVRVKVSQ